MLRVAIVTIGDEILIGQIVDTNSAWLGQQLNLLGLSVERILSISDKHDDIFATLDSSIRDYDITLVTGGLGPTKDDITKSVLCEIFGAELVVNDPSRRITQDILSRLGVDMNSLNLDQSLVPNVCEVILNHNGTAPAMMFERDGHLLISMPGVPFEMKEICNNSVFDILKTKFNILSNIHKTITTYGIAESILAERIADWENSLPSYLHLAYLPNPNRVRLRLSAYDLDNPECVEVQINEAFKALKLIIPQNYIGTETDEIEVALSQFLRSRGETLSVAESCTGGAIASKLTRIEGASAVFCGGIVAYCNNVKINLLGVNPRDIENYGAVSCQVVEQMASSIRRLTGSTYGIATSGIAGSGGGTPLKPVGTVWIAIDTPQGVFSALHTFTKLREPNIEKSSSQAMYMLLTHISKL